MKSKVLALLFALVFSLSGCLGFLGDDDPAPGTDEGTEADPTEGTEGSKESDEEEKEEEPAYEPPTASLSADVTEGVGNLSVAFTLDGTVGEGQTLSWSLDLGDGTTQTGDELPATVEHTFSEPGNFTVVLEVMDAEESADATVDILVLEPDADPVTLAGSALVVDGWAVMLDGCFMEVIWWDLASEGVTTPEGVTGGMHNIEPTMVGWSFSFDVEGVIAEFWSAEPSILGSGSEGTVPEGAAHVFVCINDPTVMDVDYTMTLTPA
jgi:PKD repeat protein